MTINSIIKDAEEFEKEYPLPKQELNIKVVGVGGAGCNSLHHLQKLGVKNIDSIAINTDYVHLKSIHAKKKILLGGHLTRGNGAGGLPEIGAHAAELSRRELETVFRGTQIAFVIAGMGGGTGTGAAPVVAEIAKEAGAIVISVATSPFRYEKGRIHTARQGIAALRRFSDCLIVLDNNKLLDIAPTLPLEHAFGVMDQVIAEMISGVTDTLTLPSLINIDYADMRTIFSYADGNMSTLLYGEGSEEEPEKIVEDALNNPFLDVDYTGARAAIIHITGGTKLTLRNANAVIEGIASQFSEDANIIFGARILPEFEGSIRVMAIAVGVKSLVPLEPEGIYEIVPGTIELTR
ncbi:MAG: cell division protein FtsZ [Thermoplasmata archaeon]